MIDWLPIPLESFPALNASLNGVAACLLTAGWFFIKRRQIAAHRNCMIAAFVVSALFLTCYLIYHYNHPTTTFPGTGVWRYLYFAILIPHIILAVGVLPFIFATFYRAFRGELDRHVRVARWTLPIWLYVSVTGVIVYLMLYQISW